MRLLVTGGAGFIGSNYVRQVVNDHLTGIREITVLDKLTYAGSKSRFSASELKKFEFIEGDIRHLDKVEKLINNCDAIINFAAETHVDRSITDPQVFVSTNILGTSTLLDVARKLGNKRFIQVSTDEVYGTTDKGSWTEDSPLLPNSPYSASKASADLICRAYSKTFEVDLCITRCSNNYGPFQFPEKVIPLFITNLIQGKKVPVYGSGVNVRDWLHVDDHCRAIHLVLLRGNSGEIYNVGGGRELTNLELTKRILNVMDRDESWIEFVKDRQGHDFRYSVDFQKISNELGYSPQKDFESGIKETVSWYLNNDNWWRSFKSL